MSCPGFHPGLWDLAIFQSAEGSESHSPGQRPGFLIRYVVRPERLRSNECRLQATIVIQSSHPSGLQHEKSGRLVGGEYCEEFHPYLAGVLNNIGGPSVQVGGASDPVHLLCRLLRTKSVGEVVESVKTSSSKWIKTKGPALAGFRWQSGYGAFSVSQSDVQSVVTYIQRQHAHHKRMSFQEEYRRFLDRYQIAYDERYVWD